MHYQNSTIQLGRRKLKREKALYTLSDQTKKKDIHNSWTQPFLSYAFYINGEIESQRYQHRLAFRDLKNRLRAENLNQLSEKKLKRIQDRHEDLFYCCVNSLYFLRLSNEKNPIKEFDLLMQVYLERIAKIEKHFEEAVSPERKRRELISNGWELVHAPQTSLYQNLVNGMQPTYRAILRGLNGTYDSSNVITKSGAIYAEESAEMARTGINYLPNTWAKVPFQSNFILLSASTLSTFTKDLTNLRRKPVASICKLSGGATFAAIPIISGITVLHWPTFLIISAACAMYLIGREAGRGAKHLYHYHQTGHINPSKYLISEKRITVLEEKFQLNRLQIEDLRTHIATQMVHAKNQQMGVLGRDRFGFFKGIGHNLSDILFSRYRHSSAQQFWKYAMRILQRSHNEKKILALIDVYNQTKPDYLASIERNTAIQEYEAAYERSFSARSLG